MAQLTLLPAFEGLACGVKKLTLLPMLDVFAGGMGERMLFPLLEASASAWSACERGRSWKVKQYIVRQGPN